MTDQEFREALMQVSSTTLFALDELWGSSDQSGDSISLLDTIQETGAQVKDLDIGLIDFISVYQDREVCLCWKLGEEGIAFWHGTEEGFAGRKPIDQDFRDGHRGDSSN